ncbi:MAG: cytochrome c [Pseudomonadales bacterium]|nr:cytochrome c [Pseudomonadales bacterium]
MRSFWHCFVLATLALLAACSEPAPTSSGDGIFTAAQAERGEGLFNTHCVRCHSIQEFRGPAWNSIWAGAPLSALYVRIANTMPLDQPGSLGSTEATAITAHILAANGMPGGEELLSGDLQWMTGISLSPTASN